MDKIIINGPSKLKGRVRISGSKNAALPILVATLLTDEPCVVSNVPELADIDTTIKLLEYIHKKVIKKNGKLIVHSNRHLKPSAPYELVRKMRASVLVMGPLIARLGRVRVSLPGGCAIGSRPIDIHLDAFKELGAEIKLQSGYVAMRTTGLTGNKIHLRFPSVGATENILLASVLAKGKTVITNAAREPEIQDLAEVLVKMGADIKGTGSKKITVIGVDILKGFTHSVIPDRIEGSTYLIASAITKGDVTLANANSTHMRVVIEKLKEAGMSIKESNNEIRAKWTKKLKPVNIKTGIYPYFPTDVQAQWMALLSTLDGKSVIEEKVFENRFLHAVELSRLGANLKIKGHKVIINGVHSLSGAPVMVSDLRAGAALVLAGLCAKGVTEVLRIYHLDRGYEHLEVKLRKLGAKIKRVAV